jgi:VWFA-related protein
MQSNRRLGGFAVPRFAVVAVVLAAGYSLHAQQASPDTVPTPAIRVTTRLVVLDVIATGKDGKPVTDLEAEDFTLEEGGKKQKIAIFGLEQPAPASALPSLPPNIYSNRPEYNMPSGPLTVLLIDALNTPFLDQARARTELIRYAATQLKPGQQTAVYALGNRLYKLQDFTSDPQVLKSAIESFQPVSLPQHGSSMAPLNTTTAAAATGVTGTLRNPSSASAAALGAMTQFQAEQATPILENRIGATLGAMTLIARELDGKPGRKNLVWVTAGFPVSLDPVSNELTFVPMGRDAKGGELLPQEQTYEAFNQQMRQETSEGVRRTAALLSDAQISIYPVDARGLIGATGVADASSAGTNSAGLLRIGSDYGQTVSGAGSRMLDSQASMIEIAGETGGRVFKNRNDIDNSVATAGGDGGTYYTLGYYSGRKKADNQFHKFSVSVKRPGVQLRYRRGYFAVEPEKSFAKGRDAELMGTLSSGNLQSTMVLFDAQIVPPAPAAKVQLPVRFLVRPESITTEEVKGGVKLNLDFVVAAFTAGGTMAAREGKTVATTIDSAQYAQVKQRGLLLPIEIALSPGDYQLRLAVRDNPTGYLGTLSAHVNLPKP